MISGGSGKKCHGRSRHRWDIAGSECTTLGGAVQPHRPVRGGIREYDRSFQSGMSGGPVKRGLRGHSPTRVVLGAFMWLAAIAAASPIATISRGDPMARLSISGMLGLRARRYLPPESRSTNSTFPRDPASVLVDDGGPLMIAFGRQWPPSAPMSTTRCLFPSVRLISSAAP